MSKYSCRLVADENWKECGFIMKSESQYLLDENMVLHENILYKLNIRKIVLFVATIIGIVVLGYAVIALGMSAMQVADDGGDENVTVELDEEVTEVVSEKVVEETAEEVKITEVVSIEKAEQLFLERCSGEYLTEEDFYKAGGADGKLGESLQYFINYIYARNGHAFQAGGTVDSLFQNESWYQEMSEKRVVTYEDLNQYEQKNIDIMVTILEREGYR